MTFIIAMQLNDSIVVAADNKEVILKGEEISNFNEGYTSKIYAWNSGIITGTGESYVINRSIALFQKIAQSELKYLPHCLNISRQIREVELGAEHYQIQNTKLLCSSYSEQGAQLYKIERFDSKEEYSITAIDCMDITVWLFNPNIEKIIDDLRLLYADLKDYACFSNQKDWMNYYINRIAPIYQKQSQQDSMMSQSFDIFFQTKDEYVFGHIPNRQTATIEFKEISPNSDRI